MTRRQFFAAFVAALVGAAGAKKIASKTKPVLARVYGDYQGGSTLRLSHLTSNLAAGDCFTIDGVSIANSEMVFDGMEKRFVVTAKVEASDSPVVVPIYPTIIPRGWYLNVDSFPKHGAEVKLWKPESGTSIAHAYREDGHAFYRIDYTDRVWRADHPQQIKWSVVQDPETWS